MYSFADDGSVMTLINEKALPFIYLTHYMLFLVRFCTWFFVFPILIKLHIIKQGHVLRCFFRDLVNLNEAQCILNQGCFNFTKLLSQVVFLAQFSAQYFICGIHHLWIFTGIGQFILYGYLLDGCVEGLTGSLIFFMSTFFCFLLLIYFLICCISWNIF